MKKNNLTDKIKYSVFYIALLFSIGCNKKEKDFPNKEKAYKIETQYLGENLIDSCILKEKFFFPDGHHMEIYYHKPGVRTSLYDERERPLMMLLEYNNKY